MGVHQVVCGKRNGHLDGLITKHEWTTSGNEIWRKPAWEDIW